MFGYLQVMYCVRMKPGAGKRIEGAGGAHMQYCSDDIDPSGPIDVFWHLVDAACLAKRRRKGKDKGVRDPLNMFEKKGFGASG